MKKLIGSFLAALLITGCAFAADQTSDKVLDRVNAAATVLQEIMAAPDKGIPEEVLGAADCVAIVPSMKNGGFVVGARYGRGIATCRNNGSWSAPAPFVVEGGSWGLQIGGQAIDLVMLVMNQHGMTQLLNSKFKVGADASAAAGPVGRHAEGSTDWKMRSEILTYSRARGAFAGITLNGAVVKQDDDSTRELFGRVIPFKQILTGNVPAPASTQTFLTNVAKYFHAARTSDQNASATRVNSSTSATTPTTGGASGTASTSTSPTTSTPSASGSVSSDTSSPGASGSLNANTGGATSSGSTTSSGAAPATSSSRSTSTSTTPQTTSTTTTTTTTTSAPASSTDTSTPPPSTSSSTSDTGSPSASSSSPSTSSTGSPSTTSTTGTASNSTQSGVNPSQLSNSEVKDLIQRALRNEPSLSSSNVNVVVTQDAVQLTGSVPSQSDKDTVRRIAEQNAGSRKISVADLGVK